jgi:hypothetical protein
MSALCQRPPCTCAFVSVRADQLRAEGHVPMRVPREPHKLALDLGVPMQHLICQAPNDLSESMVGVDWRLPYVVQLIRNDSLVPCAE